VQSAYLIVMYILYSPNVSIILRKLRECLVNFLKVNICNAAHLILGIILLER